MDSGASLTACPAILAQILKKIPIYLSEPITIIFGNKTTGLTNSYLDFPGTVLQRMYIIQGLKYCILSVAQLNRGGMEVTFSIDYECKITRPKIRNAEAKLLASVPIDHSKDLYFFDVYELLVDVPSVSPRDLNKLAIICAAMSLAHLTKQEIELVLSLHCRMNHPAASVMAWMLSEIGHGLVSLITSQQR